MSDNIPSVVDKSLLDSVDKYVKSYPDGKDATYVIDRFIRETQRHIKLVKFCASKFQDVLDPAIYIKLLANVKEHDADKLTNTNIIATYAPYNLATFVKNSGLELKLEEECHIEQKSGFSAYRLKNLPRNTAGITDKQEYFKEKTLSLRRSRNDGFSD